MPAALELWTIRFFEHRSADKRIPIEGHRRIEVLKDGKIRRLQRSIQHLVQCHQVVLVVELVEGQAGILSTLSGRRTMRSDNFKSHQMI